MVTIVLARCFFLVSLLVHFLTQKSNFRASTRKNKESFVYSFVVVKIQSRKNWKKKFLFFTFKGNVRKRSYLSSLINFWNKFKWNPIKISFPFRFTFNSLRFFLPANIDDLHDYKKSEYYIRHITKVELT